jgi:hypothetical protein
MIFGGSISFSPPLGVPLLAQELVKITIKIKTKVLKST